jgi:hypothetical protein
VTSSVILAISLRTSFTHLTNIPCICSIEDAAAPFPAGSPRPPRPFVRRSPRGAAVHLHRARARPLERVQRLLERRAIRVRHLEPAPARRVARVGARDGVAVPLPVAPLAFLRRVSAFAVVVALREERAAYRGHASVDARGEAPLQRALQRPERARGGVGGGEIVERGVRAPADAADDGAAGRGPAGGPRAVVEPSASAHQPLPRVRGGADRAGLRPEHLRRGRRGGHLARAFARHLEPRAEPREPTPGSNRRSPTPRRSKRREGPGAGGAHQPPATARVRVRSRPRRRIGRGTNERDVEHER